VVAQIPTEEDLNRNESVEFSASLEGMGRNYNIRIPSASIQEQMMKKGMKGVTFTGCIHILLCKCIYMFVHYILHGCVECLWGPLWKGRSLISRYIHSSVLCS